MGLPGLPTRPSVPPERLSLPETAARLRAWPRWCPSRRFQGAVQFCELRGDLPQHQPGRVRDGGRLLGPDLVAHFDAPYLARLHGVLRFPVHVG
jgi:hypothetical protein